jgi:hypothetical protein
MSLEGLAPVRLVNRPAHRWNANSHAGSRRNAVAHHTTSATTSIAFGSTQASPIHRRSLQLRAQLWSRRERQNASNKTGSDRRAHGLRLFAAESFGESYALTLKEWRRRVLAAWRKCRQRAFMSRSSACGTFYLCCCEGGFRAGAIDVGLYSLAHVEKRVGCRWPIAVNLAESGNS